MSLNSLKQQRRSGRQSIFETTRETTITKHHQPRPQGFSLKKWVGQEKALASAGHVHSLNIPEKLIYMQPAGFALTEVERSNNGK